MTKEVHLIIRNMTLITFFLLLLLTPFALYWGGLGVFFGLVVGLGLSLGNFYASIYSFLFVFNPKRRKNFSFGKAAAPILLGFWVRLGILGVILFFLSKISELSMFAALLAFVLFYGVLFVSEMRFLTKVTKEFSGYQKSVGE